MTSSSLMKAPGRRKACAPGAGRGLPGLLALLVLVACPGCLGLAVGSHYPGARGRFGWGKDFVPDSCTESVYYVSCTGHMQEGMAVHQRRVGLEVGSRVGGGEVSAGGDSKAGLYIGGFAQPIYNINQRLAAMVMVAWSLSAVSVSGGEDDFKALEVVPRVGFAVRSGLDVSAGAGVVRMTPSFVPDSGMTVDGETATGYKALVGAGMASNAGGIELYEGLDLELTHVSGMLLQGTRTDLTTAMVVSRFTWTALW